MSGYVGLLVLCSANFVSADLRMASQPKYVGYRLRDTGSVPWNLTSWTSQWHYRYMEPSTFGYKGLEHQKRRNYDNFLRSNIDNEQDNRNFDTEDGKDHLPFRSYESEVFDTYLWDLGRFHGVPQRPENITLTKVVEAGDPLMVPFRWNNPHASEMEVNIWIFEHAGTQPVVIPIRKPSCSGEGYQNNIVTFTIPKDFTDLGAKIPGFKGCSDTAKPMCTLQIYSHSVESRTYASGFPIVIPGHKESLTTSDSKGIKAASEDPWLDLSSLRDTCLPATDPSAIIPTAEPRWARLVSDVYTHSYQNSDYSAYSGQQHESISKNLQASAINKMEVGNRGELGKSILSRETSRKLHHLRRLEDRIYKNYEALANKIIKKVGHKMYNTGTIGIQKTAFCFRCKETGSTKNQRIETNTYIPSYQLVTSDSDAGCSADEGQVKAADNDLKVLTSISAGQKFVPLIAFEGEDYPVCGHYFWDDDHGATSVCKALGFATGKRHITRVAYTKDAMPVGRCRKDEPLMACSHRGNAYGVLDYHYGYCKKGNKIGVQVSCSGGSSSAYKTISEKGTCDNVLEEANKLVPAEYAQLVSETGLVQIYVSAMNDLMPSLYEARHLGIIYQEAIVKTSITTMSDATKFKKIDASGEVDKGKYAATEAKKWLVASKGCPASCLYARVYKPAPELLQEPAAALLEAPRNASVQWTIIWSQGSYGLFWTNKEHFNKLFQQAGTGIARRECRRCRSTHKDVYFKRKKSPATYDAYEGLLVTWRGDLNFHTDFDIYSSYEDAVKDTNAWKFCNGNDRNIGFPRDCAPERFYGWQWTSLTRGGQRDYKWSVILPQGATAPTPDPPAWYCTANYKNKSVSGPYSNLELAKKKMNESSESMQIICGMNVADEDSMTGTAMYLHGGGSLHSHYLYRMRDMCNKYLNCALNTADSDFEKPIVPNSLATNTSGACAPCKQFFGKSKEIHPLSVPESTPLSMDISSDEVPDNAVDGSDELADNPDGDEIDFRTAERRRRRRRSARRRSSLMQTENEKSIHKLTS